MWDRFILIAQTITLIITAYITLFLWRKEQFLTTRKNALIMIEEIRDIENIIKALKKDKTDLKALYFIRDLNSEIWFEKRGEFAKIFLTNEFSTLDYFFKKVEIISKIQKVMKINYEYHNEKLTTFHYNYYFEKLKKEYEKKQSNKTDKKVEKVATDNILSYVGIIPYNPIYLSELLNRNLEEYKEVSGDFVFSKLVQITNFELRFLDFKKIFLGLFPLEMFL